jgi:hypothetical protein
MILRGTDRVAFGRHGLRCCSTYTSMLLVPYFESTGMGYFICSEGFCRYSLIRILARRPALKTMLRWLHAGKCPRGQLRGQNLGGAKPADLTVEQPTKVEFAINLQTAKKIGLTIPAKVLAWADKVIK